MAAVSNLQKTALRCRSSWRTDIELLGQRRDTPVRNMSYVEAPESVDRWWTGFAGRLVEGWCAESARWAG